MKIRSKKIIALFLSLVLLAVNLSFIATSISAESSNVKNINKISQNSNMSYPDKPILLTYKDINREKTDVQSVKADKEYGNVLHLKKECYAEYSFNVPKTAAYTVALIFDDIKSTAESYEFLFEVDGKAPFADGEPLIVNTLWIDDGGIRTLPSGDQVNSAQKHKEGFKKRLLTDESGINLMPYTLILTAGRHTVTLTAKGTEFLLAGIELGIPENISSYSEVSADYASYKKYDGKQIVIEAESPLYKTAFSLTAKSDTSTPSISPNSADKALINYIGGSAWSNTGNEIAWEFEVPENGLYKMGISFKQNEVNNGQVYRWLKIDGKTPFEEASRIAFDYSTKWKFKSFSDENGNDYLIYLTKGKHTLSLDVTLSDVSEVFERLYKIVEVISSNYLDMIMITGESPDANRNYQLSKQIPDFEKTLNSISDDIAALSADIENGLKVNGELDGALKNMRRIVNEMLKSLYNSHTQIPSYYSAYQTLSAWLYDIKNMALSLDQIIFAAPDREYDAPTAGFFEKIRFALLRFASSYTNENNSVISSGEEDAPTIKLWVNWGRDQVKVLNTLIQDTFVAENKINVKIEQVNASLVQGVVSGNSPDLYLHMARTEPVNLAMRGVLYDLKNFDDFEDTLCNFQSGAEQPYIYKDGCYALPDTQSFYVMFYRTDILNELGIKVPKTWDDFISATGMLQRNKLNSYLPYVKITAATTVNTGAGGLSIFPTLLLQSGGKLYNAAQNKTELSSHESITAFKFWTDFYTRYSLEPDANFTQKFRVGTAPIGIMTYTAYLTWKEAAPEIKGKWTIAEIPGMIAENGKMNNVCSGSGTGCAIMKSSKQKEAAWDFLKWWVSADTQYMYSAELEAVLGETGRVATSNIEALSRLSWDEDVLSVINSQWKNVEEIPEVPGSYFVSRSIDQAFWAAKNGEKSPKEAIMDWADICNKEVARKIAEYADKEFKN